MQILLIISMLGILFAVFAAVGPEGFWYNLITLVNVVFAALVATNAFEPLATRAHYAWQGSGYFIDFAILWGLFAVTFAVMQVLTNIASTVKVSIGAKVDQIVGFALALVTGWVLVCFTSMTLHTAPLQRDAFGNALLPQFESGVLASLAPDRVWLNSAQKMSRASALGSGGTDQPSFDPEGEFILHYATRRFHNFRDENGLLSKRKWGATTPQGKDVSTP